MAAFYLEVPGLAGTPHVNPHPKPYSWTSPTPVPHQKLLQALAALEPLGLLPAADVADWQAAAAAAAATAAAASTGTWPSRLASPGTGQPDQAGIVDAVRSNSGADIADSTSRPSNLKSRSVAAVYPSGRLFVRCGWVPDSGVELHAAPFESSTGATTTAAGSMAFPMLQSLHLPPPSSPGFSAALDGTVQISLQGGRTTTASGSPTAKGLNQTMRSSVSGHSPHTSPSKAGMRGFGPHEMISNPLAHIGEDVEVGARLAPPVPHVKADRALHRAANGGSKVSSKVPASCSPSECVLMHVISRQYQDYMCSTLFASLYNLVRLLVSKQPPKACC